MGRGDVKTRKGKISKGTFGVRRMRKSVAAYVPVTTKAKPKKVAEEKEVEVKQPASKAGKPAAKKAPAKKPAAKAEKPAAKKAPAKKAPAKKKDDK